MSKRIGKFKITKRESEVSLVDGGTVSGDLTVTGASSFSGLVTATNGILNKGVTVSGATSSAIDLTSTTGNHKLITTATLAAAIKLPQATAANLGMMIEVYIGADTATDGSAKIQVENGETTVFSGGIILSTTGAKMDAIIVTTNAQSIELDADAADHAGGIEGSVYRFYYFAAGKIFVDARGITSAATPALDGNASTTSGF